MKRGTESRIIKMAGTQLLKNRFSICTTEGIVLFSVKAHEETQVVKQQAKQNRMWMKQNGLHLGCWNQPAWLNKLFGGSQTELENSSIIFERNTFYNKKSQD